jgi:hypothetical protein
MVGWARLLIGLQCFARRRIVCPASWGGCWLLIALLFQPTSARLLAWIGDGLLLLLLPLLLL